MQNDLMKKEIENHCFNTLDALDFGLPIAVILWHFRFWIRKNQNDNRNFYDGTYWTFSTVDGLAKSFEYFTKHQVRRHIEKMEEMGLLKVGNYNKVGYDKTKWYALTDLAYKNTICQIELANLPNGIGENAKPIPDTLKDTLKDSNNNNELADLPKEPQPKTFAEIKTERGIMTDKEALDEAVKDQMFIERLCMQVSAQKNISHELMQCYFVAVYSFWIYDLKTTHDNRKDFRNHLINTIKKDIAGNQTLYKDAITIFNQRKNKQK
jgi:hypothetical protein